MSEDARIKAASDISAEIRRQYNAMRSVLCDPSQVHLNRKDFAELDRYYADTMVYEGNSKSGIRITFHGLRIKVHDDFPNPVVS